ncbi:HNH endonuclease signature motif containing protein [Caballeronia sp. LZ043]|uniref:HNH endonuclease n=1 Tax=Caballeronia sp. LZ043 TaxID=3038569 RepID=UPI002864259F|nr:HNH endonuclease signature motif containing protein [Caballeronia sp. LZ043]MDR5820441.1 HNH endonuclease signature motif containing protein [Caballeronia sp. LZ043]
MASLNSILERLSPSHRAALQWFKDFEGQEVSWPKPLPDGTFIVNKAKGIHKPKGMDYAVSVRQSLQSPYADHELDTRPDGSWSYRYFQEQLDPEKRDSQFTNRALLACKADGIPVGVLRQVKAKPQPRYKILGLASVHDWKDGYFELRSFASGEPSNDAPGIEQVELAMHTVAAFDPSNLQDARRWIDASIVVRQGQATFRRQLLDAYERRCALTNCSVEEVLEAAHICGYLGKETNDVRNGLLLRADLHTLYDRKLIAIDPATHKVLIAPELEGTEYASLAGHRLRLPKDAQDQPSSEALHSHWLNVCSIREVLS